MLFLHGCLFRLKCHCLCLYSWCLCWTLHTWIGLSQKKKEQNPPSGALPRICTCKQLPIESACHCVDFTRLKKIWLNLRGRGVTAPLNVPLQFQWHRMSSCNCCAHYWTESTKCIHLAREHDCEKGEIKNGTASNDGINRRLEQMAAAGMGWEDAGKRACVCHAGVLIKVQRGRLSLCLGEVH